jgi:hypothetical protein
LKDKTWVAIVENLAENSYMEQILKFMPKVKGAKKIETMKIFREIYYQWIHIQKDYHEIKGTKFEPD